MYDSLKITPKTRGYPIIFNHTNFHLYHYAGNNPIRYIDPTGLYEYTVQAGDTLSQMVQDHNKKYNTNYSYKGIALHNGISNPDKLSIGQIIDIPIPGEDMQFPVYHPLKKHIYPESGWTRGDTENACTWIGIILGIGTGISIFICPVATPFLMGAMVVNDGVNITCRALDFSEDPSAENLTALLISGAAGVFDVFAFGSGMGWFNNALSKTPLFRFSLNSMGRPFYKATGQFMAYNIAAMWWFTDFILVPVVENVTPDIYKDAASEE